MSTRYPKLVHSKTKSVRSGSSKLLLAATLCLLNGVLVAHAGEKFRLLVGLTVSPTASIKHTDQVHRFLKRGTVIIVSRKKKENGSIRAHITEPRKGWITIEKNGRKFAERLTMATFAGTLKPKHEKEYRFTEQKYHQIVNQKYRGQFAGQTYSLIRGLTVSTKASLSSKFRTDTFLKKGTKVTVVEAQNLPNGIVRAKIQEPSGWITLKGMTRWYATPAIPKNKGWREWRVESPVTSKPSSFFMLEQDAYKVLKTQKLYYDKEMKTKSTISIEKGQTVTVTEIDETNTSFKKLHISHVTDSVKGVVRSVPLEGWIIHEEEKYATPVIQRIDLDAEIASGQAPKFTSVRIKSTQTDDCYVNSNDHLDLW